MKFELFSEVFCKKTNEKVVLLEAYKKNGSYIYEVEGENPWINENGAKDINVYCVSENELEQVYTNI